MSNNIEKIANQIAAEKLRDIAAQLIHEAGKLEMGDKWSDTPDRLKPELEIVR